MTAYTDPGNQALPSGRQQFPCREMISGPPS